MVYNSSFLSLQGWLVIHIIGIKCVQFVLKKLRGTCIWVELSTIDKNNWALKNNYLIKEYITIVAIDIRISKSLYIKCYICLNSRLWIYVVGVMWRYTGSLEWRLKWWSRFRHPFHPFCSFLRSLGCWLIW